MGLGSENAERRKQLAKDAGGTKWKDKLSSPEDCYKLIETLTAKAPKDFAGRLMDSTEKNRILSLKAYLNHLKTEKTGGTDVHCVECGACLYTQETALLTYHEFMGLGCTTPKQCNTPKRSL